MIDFVMHPNPPVSGQSWIIVHTPEESSKMTFCQNGSYRCNKPCEGTQTYFTVMPLKDLTPGYPGKAFEMFASFEELGKSLQTIEIYTDEGTGVVVIWGWDMEAQETKIFVGDSV